MRPGTAASTGHAAPGPEVVVIAGGPGGRTTAHRGDGVHLDAENTRAIGTAFVPAVRQALGL